MAPVVEVITERLELGEGPHWDVDQQCLYLVDILGQAILKYVPSTGKTTKAVLGKKKSNLLNFKKSIKQLIFYHC